MLSVLKNRTYRHLFMAQVIALVGTGMTSVALALLAYDLAGGSAGTVLGNALALKMVAYVFIAPAVGGFAHKLPRKALLVILDLMRAGFVLCLPFVSEVWHVYLLIFLLYACSAGFTPTFQATIPDVLPDEKDYTKALSLSRMAYDLENLLSPTIAALALLFLNGNFDALFQFNTVAFVFSALLVVTVTLPRGQAKDHGKGVLHNLTFGVRKYLSTPRLRGLLALSMAVSAAGAMMIINTVVYVMDHLGMQEDDVPTAMAFAGAGSMLVALTLPKVLEKKPDRPVMLSGAALLAAGLFAGLSMPGFIMLLPIWFALGVGSSLIQTPSGRLLKRSSEAGDRPAIYAAQFALSHACWLVTYQVAGRVGDVYGLFEAFAVLGGIVVISGIAAAFLWRGEEQDTIPDTHENTTG